MDQHCNYRIEVRGEMDEKDLNASSPVQMAVLKAGSTTLLFSAHTDQSGLIGLIRHLHGLGLALLSVNREG